MELNAYHDAPPQPFLADAEPAAITELIATVAAIAAMRIFFAKVEPFPSVSFCGDGFHRAKMAKKCLNRSRNINISNINRVINDESAESLTQPQVIYRLKTGIKQGRAARALYSRHTHKNCGEK